MENHIIDPFCPRYADGRTVRPEPEQQSASKPLPLTKAFGRCGVLAGKDQDINALFAGRIFARRSRTTSLAGLSSRRPLNEPWRISPSAVQPRNSISHSSFGFAHRTPLRFETSLEPHLAGMFEHRRSVLDTVLAVAKR
jgi:hypothetical protein